MQTTVSPTANPAPPIDLSDDITSLLFLGDVVRRCDERIAQGQPLQGGEAAKIIGELGRIRSRIEIALLRHDPNPAGQPAEDLS